MIFVPTIINNTKPQVSVTAADSGNPPVTYNQILNSLGHDVYVVDEFYLFSTISNQLIGVVKYNRYDASGSEDITNIATTIDPYQLVNAINVDLKKYPISVILNGNSSLSAKILGNAFLQFRLYCRRISNAYQLKNYNFKQLEQIFKKEFYSNYEGYEADGKLVILETNQSQPIEIETKEESKEILKDDRTSLAILSLAAFSLGLYIFSKNE